MQITDIPFYRQFPKLKNIRLSTKKSIKVNQGYFRIRFVEMRLGRDLVGTKIFTPVLHSLMLNNLLPNGKNEVIISAKIPQAETKDGGDNTKILLGTELLCSAIPFNGQNANLWIGLFSVPVKDLAGEMIGLLSTLLNPLQNRNLTTALGITQVLSDSINALFGLSDTKLLFGWQGNISLLDAIKQEYIIITQPDANLDPSKFSILKDKLLYDGKEPNHMSYFVFCIEVSNHRRDWYTLDEIKVEYNQWNQARSLYAKNPDEYNQVTSNLLNALRSSPNIVPLDAELIIRDEILPLMKMGDQVQASLFITSSIKAEGKEDILLDFACYDAEEGSDYINI